jgi:sRNA-binding protein
MTGRPRIVGKLTLPGFRAKTPHQPVPPPPAKEPPPLEIPRKQRVVRLVAILAGRWPAVFGGGAVRPLAIGIDVEIKAGLAGEAPNNLISRTLNWWTCRDSYLTALTQPDARRYGLDGGDAGPVGDLAREIAARQLEARLARRGSVT